MKKYKINDITVLVNSLIPFKGFLAMAFYNIVFWRKEYETYLIKEHHKSYVDKVINHEDIHVCQMKDFCKWLPIGIIKTNELVLLTLKNILKNNGKY